MANNFDSNVTEKLAKGLLPEFETSRVVSKEVNTTKLSGQYNTQSGDLISFPRATDYTTIETSDGDISAQTKSDIIVGKATGTVQDYITVAAEWSEAEEALKMGNTNDFFERMGKRLVTKLETNFAKYAMSKCGLLAGTVGTAATTWAHVAKAGAVLETTGVPNDGKWCYLVNPYTQIELAGEQRGLGGETGAMTANQRATINSNFAGLKVLSATTLANYTTGAGADRVGALASNPVVTYAGTKDTMTQDLVVSGFSANLSIKAGERVTISGRYRLNLDTKEPIVDGAGNRIPFSAVVAQDVTLDGTGAGTIKIAGPAIYEATGAYNTVDSAPVSTDVVTLGGAESTIIQPNLFFHKDAFGIGSVPMQKLYATDTIVTTKDGLQIRVSKYADGDKNRNKIRFDMRPAFIDFNPLFAGHGFGS